MNFLCRIGLICRSYALVFSLGALSACVSTGAGHSTDSVEAERYSHLMHNRFYEAWTAPKSVGASLGKVSVPVNVQIDRGGRVLHFNLVKPSGYPKIDMSIRQVGKKITQVAPPPLGRSQRIFDLRIYFELDVKR